jgi:hypothetical protein
MVAPRDRRSHELDGALVATSYFMYVDEEPRAPERKALPERGIVDAERGGFS